MHKWACLIPPHKDPPSRDDLLWSEWVESVRKDVECFFGKMKARWQFLKNASLQHDSEIIEAAFKCCCVINNMLLKQSIIAKEAEDVNETKEAFLDAFAPNYKDAEEDGWENEDCAETNGDEQNQNIKTTKLWDDEAVLYRVDALAVRKRAIDEVNIPSKLTMYNYKSHSQIKAGIHFGSGFADFDKLRRSVTNNFLFQYLDGKITRPQRMTTKKSRNDVMFDIAHRIQQTADSYLYISESSCVELQSGLYSRISYTQGNTIAFFEGDRVNSEELTTRRTRNSKRQGYAVKLIAGYWLDTYDQYVKRECWASYANSPHNATYIDKRRGIVTANCELFITQDSKVGLRALGDIWNDTEILWNGFGYGLQI